MRGQEGKVESMKKEPSIVRGLFEHSEESSLEAPDSGNWATLYCRTKIGGYRDQPGVYGLDKQWIKRQS